MQQISKKLIIRPDVNRQFQEYDYFNYKIGIDVTLKFYESHKEYLDCAL